jgi:microcystin-dependent protein
VGTGSRQALSAREPEPRAPIGSEGRLTEEEIRLVSKLLGDPTYFPLEFRTWLRQYIEGAGIQISESQIIGGGEGGGSAFTHLPAGIIIPLGSNTIPVDTLLCDGSSKSRQEFGLLFQAIGTAWGSDSADTFKVPDLRDRALYGQGGLIALGQTDGVAFGSRGGPNHHHAVPAVATDGVGDHQHYTSGVTDSQGQHNHQTNPQGVQFAMNNGTVAPLGSGGSNRNIVTNLSFNTLDGGVHAHNWGAWSDARGAHAHTVPARDTVGGYSDKPSWAGVNYAITTGKS